MEEVWKDVVGYEGYYQVSNLGRVRSLDREMKCVFAKSGKKIMQGRVLRYQRGLNGYKWHVFSVDGERKLELLHRIVAKAFIPNPDSIPQVNHKDENIDNNCVENLEWCTSKYNANYGTRNKRFGEKHRKPVIQKDKQGQLIKAWDSMKDACESCGADPSSMGCVCRGKQETCVGYKWEYA